MLMLMYKYCNGCLPDYLIDIIPTSSTNNHPYFLRNSENLITLARRTELYSKSIIPSSVKLWNDLDLSVRNSPSLSVFKNTIDKQMYCSKVPPYFNFGKRRYSVYHARLRNRCSNLNSDLFCNSLLNTPSCGCGYEWEDAEHFFFSCHRFNIQRQKLFRATRLFHPLNVNTLLFGDVSYTNEENEFIFKEVQEYIENSNRFT